MSSITALQLAVAEALRTAPQMRVKLPIVAVRKSFLGSDVEVAVAKKSGLCILVIPPLPKSAMGDEVLDFVMLDNLEVTVGIYEQPALNAHAGYEAYDAMDDVMLALHGRSFPEMLSHPLTLQKRPVSYSDDERIRVVEVFFKAVMPLTASPDLTPPIL